MPKGFDWVSMDVNDPIQLQEIYTLLTENYVEDDDNMFRYIPLTSLPPSLVLPACPSLLWCPHLSQI